MTYLKPCQWRPIVSSIDLISPQQNTHLVYHIWMWKVLQNMGIVFPCHLLLQWGLMEISMNFHGFGGYLCSWRLFVLYTPPKTSLIWTPEGQGWSADSMWRLWQGNWLIWRSRPYAIYGNPCAFEGQGWSSDHPGSIICLFHSDLNSACSNT